jgi:dynein heavy chain
MLRCFEVLTKKEAVRKALEKKTEGTLILFHSQIADSRSRFDRNRLSPTLMDDEPTFAGAASWARGMKRRIEHDWALLQQARPWLPKVSESFGAMRWCCVHPWVRVP